MEVGLGPNPPFAGTKPPTVLSNGVYDVGVDNNGLLQSLPNSTNAPTQCFLNDSAGGSWEIFVNDKGHPDRNSIAADVYPAAFPMVSLNGDKLYQLTITPQGNLSTEAIGIIGRDPQMFLRWSDDGGRTWSQERILDCGQLARVPKTGYSAKVRTFPRTHL